MTGRAWAAALALLFAAPFAGCFGPHPSAPPAATGTGIFRGPDVFAGTYDKSGDYSKTARPGPYKIGEPQEVKLTSTYDGVDLLLEYVLPAALPAGDKAPVIVLATPYLGPMTPEGMKADGSWTMLVENFVPYGYAVAFVPVRGTSDQGGCMDLFGKAERSDLDQAVTWLGTQAWSNGNVGMAGVSYDGSTPWEVAAMGNPHLKTIVPESGVNDVWSLSYHNGSVQWFGSGGLVGIYYLYSPEASSDRSAQHEQEGAACPASWKGLAASAWASSFVSRDEPTGFFAERNLRPDVVANYDGSVFWVHGLRDFRVDPAQGYEMVQMLEAKGLPVKTLLGQWDHGWPDATAYHPGDQHVYARWDWAEILLHWFDYWLKGDHSVDLGPRVQVQDSLKGWRSEDEWPPADVKPARFFLDPNGGLSRNGTGGSADLVVGPNPDDDSTQYLVDLVQHVQLPVLAAPCPTCPAFETAPFAQEERIAGRPTLHVIANPSGPGGHIAAFLYEVKDGVATRIGRGQIDLRLADGGETAKPVVPDTPLVAKLQFEPMDAVLPAGSTLRLVLTQGSYEERLPTTPTYPVRVTAGGTGGPGAASSVLTVDLFERPASALFTPP
jgi:putative CocE/NonD family hydrolase